MRDDVRASLRHWLQNTCPHLVETINLPLSTICKHQGSNQRTKFRRPSIQVKKRCVGGYLTVQVQTDWTANRPWSWSGTEHMFSIQSALLLNHFINLYDYQVSSQLLWLNIHTTSCRFSHRKEKNMRKVLLWMISLLTV